MNRQIFFLALLVVFSTHAVQLSDAEKMSLPYATGKAFMLGDTGWRIHAGDVKGFEKKDFDDSSWFLGNVSRSASGQGISGSPWILYRKEFSISPELAGKTILLDLGFISFYDEAYIDGMLIGSYGTYPKGITGSSWMRRRYILPDALAAGTGTHTLAVRTYAGYASGMYNGSPYLCELKRHIYPKYILKEPRSLQWNLSDAQHLNHFFPGTRTYLHPRFTTLGSPGTMQLQATLQGSDGKNTILPTRTIRLVNDEWSDCEPIPVVLPQKLGRFSVNLTLTNEHGIISWEQTLYGRCRNRQIFEIPVDTTLTQLQFPLDVSSIASGSFGPRHFKAGKLIHDFDIPDTRGTLAFSVRPSPKAPLILHTHVKPMPKPIPTTELLAAKGATSYDGFQDAWLMGSVTSPQAGRLNAISTVGNWTKLCYKYQYENIRKFDFTISAISPAWRLETDSETLRIFDGIEDNGVGLPQLIAMECDGVPLIHPLKTPLDTSKMSANWSLVSFNGSNGFDAFDIPWLFVLQHRPASIAINSGALELDYGCPAGTILAMPLYGVTLQEAQVTASWSNGLPEDVIQRCRAWSRILANAPDTLTRKAAVDFQQDALSYEDCFTYLPLNDEWSTIPITIAPIAPLLPPTLMAAKHFSGAISHPAQDLDYATLHGPLHAVIGSKVITQFKGLLHFIPEVRQITLKEQNADSVSLKKELSSILEKHFHIMQKHPWPDTVWRGKYVPGNQEPAFTNILLTLPYLSNDLAQRILDEYKKEVENYLLYDGVPSDDFAEKLLPKLRKRPVSVSLTTPTGLKLTTFVPQETDYGIDSCCFEAQLCYMLWSYAHHSGEWEFVKRSWPRILESANLLPNAYSWPICCSYDTFSGIRVGNGLQETGVMHAGFCAIARMAHKFGDIQLRDKASYFAAMQLVALNGAMSMNAYLRERRPLLPESTQNGLCEFSEYYRQYHYVEFNENGGFTQHVMHAEDTLNSPRSFIMTTLPEIMRPYRELFPELTDDYFSLNYRHIPFNRCIAEPLSPDMAFYMTSKYPLSIRQLRVRRSFLPFSWQEHANDIRVELDALNLIQYVIP